MSARFSVAFVALSLLSLIGVAQASQPTLAYFKSLTKDTPRTQVHKDVGDPSRVMGSGLIIDVYTLSDGSEVSIVWSGPDGNLVYVSHGDTTLVK
jgi:hypothetical protein